MNSLSLFAEEFTMTSPCGGLCTAVIGLNKMRFQIGSDSLSLCKLQACWLTWRLFLVTEATEGSLGNFSHFKKAARISGCSGPEKCQIRTRKTAVEWSPLFEVRVETCRQKHTLCGGMHSNQRRRWPFHWFSLYESLVVQQRRRFHVPKYDRVLYHQVEPKPAALENLHRSCFSN